MIEADIKGFLNDRTPNDPLFMPLNKQIDEGLDAIKYEKRRRLYYAASESVKAISSTSESSEFLTSARNKFIQSNIFVSGHYSYGLGYGHINQFVFKLSDDMRTFAYLYSDAGSSTYKLWKLAGAYNPVFLAAGKRTAMTFGGFPSVNDEWVAMDMSADGSIICLSKKLSSERLVVLKLDSGSDTDYKTVSVDKQPDADITSMRMSGDGTKIFITMASAPYLLIYEANADKTVYKQARLSDIGITMSRAAAFVVPNFDGTTVALAYSTNSAAKPALDVYRILSGKTYTMVGIEYVLFNNLTALFHSHRDGLQISRDGNTILAYFLNTSTGTSSNNYNNNYVPFILKFNEADKNFSFNLTEQNNQLWRISYTNPAYGAWPASGLTSGYGTVYRPLLSADGNWLFCASLTRRSNGTPAGAFTQLSVMDISSGKIQRAVTIHYTFLASSGFGSSYYMPHIFWVDPKMKYVFIGVIPNTNYSNSSPYYAYYLHTSGYDKAYEIILLDDNWVV